MVGISIRTAAVRATLFVTFALNLKAQVIPIPRSAQYKFDFGDGSPTEWLAEPATSHQYLTAGTYQPFLIAQVEEREFRSPLISIVAVEPGLAPPVA
ncbi:MAG: PKD domain-containing protein [Acidobacteria bacterium]|nr:PKD domain-containing protein [Acidobacteriota bacterium]